MGDLVWGSGEAGFLAGEGVEYAENRHVVVDGDAAAERVEAGEPVLAASEAATREAIAEGEVEQGIRIGVRVLEEEERRLGGEIGRDQWEESSVRAAAGTEGEEILKAREAPRDLADQIQREVGGGGGGGQ